MRKLSRQPEMAISEHELASLTSDMADAQADHFPQMLQAASDREPANPEQLRRSFSRRNFLASATALVGGGVVLATAGPALASGRRVVTNNSETVALATVPTDVRVAALAASLENLAVATYGAALQAATAGKLGTVPAAVATFVKTASSQHAAHAGAWNSLVVSSGYKKITAVDPVVQKSVNAAFAKVSNVSGVAKLALTLENAAAATYLEALQVVSSTTAINVAASIQPVEMQHAAILNFILGNYPVPAAFASLTGARPISDFTAISKT